MIKSVHNIIMNSIKWEPNNVSLPYYSYGAMWYMDESIENTLIGLLKILLLLLMNERHDD